MKKSSFPILAVVLCVAFAVLARVCGMVYTGLATNVVYSETLLCRMLPALRQVMSALSFACIAGGAMSCAMRGVSSKKVLLAYAVIATAENLVPVVIDIASGVFADDPARLIMGILYRLGLALYAALMLIIGTAVGRGIINRDGSPAVAVVFAAVLPVFVDFVVVVVRSITSLFEWDFMPYSSEIWSMLGELGTVVLMGLVSAVASLLLVGKKQ